MKASHIIESYLTEVKNLKIIPFKELHNRILNWFKSEGFNTDEIEIEETGDWYDIDHEGVSMISIIYPFHLENEDSLSESDEERFEKEVLSNTNYSLRSGGQSPEHWEMGQLHIEGRLPVKKPEFLYHETQHKNVDKILNRGLKPVSGRHDNPEGPGDVRWSEPRVYFWKNKGVVDSALRNQRISVIELDTKKFNRFNLFVDVAQQISDGDGYYTLTHIPPNALRLMISDDI